MKTSLALFFTALLPLAIATADTPPAELATEIAVVGDAPSAAAPDNVTLTAKLDSTAASASEAMSQLDGRASKLVEALRTVCPGLQSRTRSDVFPGQSPGGAGLRAGTAVQIQRTLALDCSAVEKTGKLVDAALAVSGTEVLNVSFSVRDSSKPVFDAVQLATKRAQEKATLVATSLGVKLGPVISTVVTEEPEGQAIREQLAQGKPALEYGDKVQHIYVTVRYGIAR